MTPQEFARLKTLFGEALDLPHGDRDAFIERECNHPQLARELRSLLANVDATSVPRIAPARLDHMVRDAFGDEDRIKAILERTLGNEYRDFHYIDKGGMGVVYRARHIALDFTVAIKVLRQDISEHSMAAVERFKREARIAASLSHPGIVHLYQFGEACGIWYFVMSYVHGETLAKRLRLEGAVSPRDVRRMLLELADALEYAHRNGVIHRDIKSANILLENDDIGRPMLADFGIAKIKGAARSLTGARTIMGTLAYMSPEQLVGDDDIDERSDIFSLGLVGYAMLSGREPFADIDGIAEWRRINDPEPLEKVAPNVPSELAGVIMRCLRRDREARFPDARSLKEALARTEGVWQPDVVRPIAGFGQYALLWAIIWTALAIVPDHPPEDRALLLLLAVMVPLGLVLHIMSTGLGGLTFSQLARVACWPPEWWGMWWPPWLRRPDDMWTRLPWQGQLTRAAVSLCFVMIPALILAERRLPVDDRVVDITKYSLLGGAILVALSTSMWAIHRKLPFPDAFLVLLGSTMASPRWQVPHVARLLAPVRGVRPPNPSQPEDWVRAIDELVPLLPGSAPEPGADATVRAHRLRRAISTCREEIEGFDRFASDTEVKRLDDEIMSLEDEISRVGSDMLRDLLKSLREKREAVLGIGAQRSRVDRERGGLFTLLRELWVELSRLYDRSVGRAAEGPDPAVGLRTLCSEIDRVLDDFWTRHQGPDRAP